MTIAAALAAMLMCVCADRASAATAPTLTISSPPASSVLASSTATVEFIADNDPTSVTCKLDAGTASACSSPVTYTGLADGSHTVTVVAKNTAGTATLARAFKVDTVSPVVAITAPAAGASVKSPTRLTFTTTDATTITSRTCSVDGGDPAACVSGATFTLAGGDHTIGVSVTDSAGNVGSSSVSFSVATIPTLSITAPAANAIFGSNEAAVAFEATNEPTSVTCKLDAGAAAPCTSPATFNGLSDGTHTVYVTASNVAGSTTASRAFKVDTTAPAVAITTPAVGASVKSPARLTFTTADATPISSRSCSVDGADPVACVSGAMFTLAGGDHTISVAATDSAGNVGSSSVNFSVATIPTVTITAPAAGAIFGAPDASVSYETANEPTSVSCKLDTGTAAPCTSPAVFTGLADGTHTVYVTASNIAGSVTASRAFKIDTAPPGVTIAAPAAGSSVKSPVALTFSTTDATPVVAKTCSVDGAAPVSCVSGATFALSGGGHSISVSATDSAGNVGSSAVSFSVATAPTLTISAPPSSAVLGSSTASVEFVATNDPTSVTCKLDAGTAAPCTSHATYTDLAEGSHTVTIVAKNAAGTATLARAFKVDTIPPVVTITAPTAGANVKSPARLTFTTTDATTITSRTCSVDGGEPVACVSGATFALAGGDHTIGVSVTDSAGNVGSSSVSFFARSAPRVTITSPAADAVVHGTAASIEFTATESPTTIRCKIDGGTLSACASPKLYTSLADGLHVVTVSATNATGTGTASVSFTIQSQDRHVEITSGPDNGSRTNAQAVEFAFNLIGSGGTECRMDEADWAPCESPFTSDYLYDGEHVFVVRPDGDEVPADSASRTFNVDSSPPIIQWDSAPSQFDPNPVKHFDFTVTDDSPPIVTSCALDGGEFAPCETSYEASDLAVGEHFLTIRAIDALGNAGEAVSSTFDSFDPNDLIAFTNLPDGAMGPNSSPVGISARVPVPHLACSFEMHYEGGYTNYSYSDPCPSSYELPRWSYFTGRIVITATAYDYSYSQLGEPAVVEFEVDLIPPTVSITNRSSLGDQSPDASHDVQFESPDDVDHFECAENDGPASVCNSPWTATDLPECVSKLTVYAVDAAGNRGEDSDYYWRNTSPSRIDTSMSCPTPAIDENPGGGPSLMATFSEFGGVLFGPAVTADPWVDGRAWPAGTSIYCKMNERPWYLCDSPQNEKNAVTGPGPQTLQVATEFDGVRDPHPASISWNSSLEAATPTATIYSGPASSSSSANPEFAFSSDVVGSTFECKFDDLEWKACGSPYSPGDFGSQLDAGSHQFAVLAKTESAAQTEPTTFDFVVTGALPAPIITSGPRSGDQVTGDVTFGFTSIFPAASYECSVDGSPFAECTSPLTMPANDLAIRRLAVRAVSAVGGQSAAATRWVRGDGEGADVGSAQATILDGPLEGSTSPDPGVVFSFDSNIADATFVCSMDGEDPSPCESSASYSLADGPHAFSVIAIGSNGVASGTPATRSFSVDFAAGVEPDTFFEDRPEDRESAPGSNVEYRHPLVSFSSNRSDATFECRADLTPWTPCSSPFRATMAADWDLMMAMGINWHHWVEVRATAGGRVDSTPAYSWMSPPAQTYETAGADIYPVPDGDGNPSWSTAMDGIKVSSGTVSVRAGFTSDGYPTQCAIDDGDYRICSEPELTVSGLANGTHRLLLRSPAAPFHVPLVTSIDFVVDSTPDDPAQRTQTPTITAGPDGEAIESSTAEFEFEAAPGTTAECRVDDDDFHPCSSPFQTPDLSEGTHSFSLRARSVAGGISEVVDRVFDVPNTRPESGYDGAVVLGQSGEEVTPQAINAIKQALATPPPAPVAARTMSLSSSSSTGGVPAVDHDLLKSFLVAAGVWPKPENFMATRNFWGQGGDSPVQVNVVATVTANGAVPLNLYRPLTQHFTAGTYAAIEQHFPTAPVALTAIKNVQGWQHTTVSPITGDLGGEDRFYIQGTDMHFATDGGCWAALLWCNGWSQSLVYSAFDGDAGCNPMNEDGSRAGYGYMLSLEPQTFGSLGAPSGNVEQSFSEVLCEDLSHVALFIRRMVATTAEWLSVGSAYSAFVQGLDEGECGFGCPQLMVDLNSISKQKLAELCGQPSFFAICNDPNFNPTPPTFGPPNGPNQAGEPVDAATGNFEFDKIDLAADGSGPSLKLKRTYNSLDERVSAMGRGFMWAGSERLATLASGNARVEMPDGKTLDFVAQPDGSYVSPYGANQTLVKTGVGSAATYVMTDRYGVSTTTFGSDGRVLTIADHVGNAITFHYDSLGRLESQTNGEDQSITYTYGEDGYLATATDSNNRTVVYGHEGDRLTSVEDPEHGVVRYAYDEFGYLSSATNPDGNVMVTNVYDGEGRVTDQQVANSPWTHFEYRDGSTVFTNEAGQRKTFRYNSRLQVSSTEDASGRYVYHRDATGNVTSISRPDGLSTVYEYDALGRVTYKRDPAGRVWSWTYDGSQVSTRTDPLGRVTHLSRFPNGDIERITEPTGASVSFTYSSPGVVESRTDELGHVTTYEHDAAGRVTKTTDPLGGTTSTEYDQHGNVESLTNRNDETASYDHSPMGDVRSATDPLGNSMTFGYDDSGRLTRTTDPRGIQTDTAYDLLGREVETKVDGVRVSATGYDVLSRPVERYDANGAITRLTYDEQGNLRHSETPERETTSYRYDVLGAKTREISPRGNTTAYEHDLAGNLTLVKDAKGGETRFTYDLAGNLKTKTDPLGHVTTYTYDANNRLLEEARPGRTITYVRDAAGRVSSRTVAGETTQYERDALGRVTKVTLADGGEERYTYDAEGNILTARDLLGRTVDFTYDHAGRVETTTDASGKQTVYERDPDGNVTKETGPDGETTLSYDNRNRPTTITTPRGREHRFTYDGTGNVLEHSVYKSAGSEKLILRTTNLFDSNGRLLSADTRDATGKSLAKLAYRYDADGHATQKRTGSSVQSYTYDAASRLTRVDYGDHSDTYDYDLAGNRTEKNGASYGYNEVGQMTSSPGSTYAYDAQGRRIEKAGAEGAEHYTYNSLDQMTSFTSATGKVYAYDRDALGRLSGAHSDGFARSFDYGLSDLPAGVSTTNTTTDGSSTHRDSYSYSPRGIVEIGGEASEQFPLLDSSGEILGGISDDGAAAATPESDPFGVQVDQPSAADPGYSLEDRVLGYRGGMGNENLPGPSGLTALGDAAIYDAESGIFTTSPSGPDSSPGAPDGDYEPDTVGVAGATPSGAFPSATAAGAGAAQPNGGSHVQLMMRIPGDNGHCFPFGHCTVDNTMPSRDQLEHIAKALGAGAAGCVAGAVEVGEVTGPIVVIPGVGEVGEGAIAAAGCAVGGVGGALIPGWPGINPNPIGPPGPR